MTLVEIRNYIIKKTAWAIVSTLFLVLLYKFGLAWVFGHKGPPRSELFATVNCESWKTPYCIDDEIQALVTRIKHIDEVRSHEDQRLRTLKDEYRTVFDLLESVDLADGKFKYLDKDALKNLEEAIDCVRDSNIATTLNYKFPESIQAVMHAESMYTIKVINKGDIEATNPIMTIPDNLYSEVIREIGKGDKDAPEKLFKPKEIELKPIHPQRTVDVISWVSCKAGRRSAKKVKISCEGRSASLYVKPCRSGVQWVDKNFWEVIILVPVVLLLFYLPIIIRRRRRSAIDSSALTQPK